WPAGQGLRDRNPGPRATRPVPGERAAVAAGRRRQSSPSGTRAAAIGRSSRPTATLARGPKAGQAPTPPGPLRRGGSPPRRAPRAAPAARGGARFGRGAGMGRGGAPARPRHCDANWTNAVRTTLKGRDHIVDYSRRLFADPRFAAGWLVGEPHLALRWLGAD